MSAALILQPVFAGLSVGVFCMTTCFPFLASFTVSESRSLGFNTGLILRFLLGRLAGYLLFGFVFGFLGQASRQPVLAWAADISLLLLSGQMLLHLAGLLKQKGRACYSSGSRNRNAAVMGFLLGVNVCPPFLMSLAYVFSLRSAWQGVLYFLIFFFSSSVYFLPMIFVGMLGRIAVFAAAARWSGIVSAAVFMVYALLSIRGRLG